MRHSLAALLAAALLAGCENSLLDRSLVFATHTTLGLEVAVSPAETSSPVRLVIGYKRSEGVLNPVYYNHNAPANVRAVAGGTTGDGPPAASPPAALGKPPCDGCDVERYYLKEAYSVLAKFRGDTSAQAGETAQGKLSVAQWFATGEAAKVLARQPGIAGAVTGSAEIAQAAVGMGFVSGVGDRIVPVLYDITALVGALPAKTQARVHANFNAVADQMPIAEDVIFFRVAQDDAGQPGLQVDDSVRDRLANQRGLQRMLNYRNALKDSAEALETDLDAALILDPGAATARSPNPLEKSTLGAQRGATKRALESFQEFVESNDLLAETMQMICEELVQTKE